MNLRWASFDDLDAMRRVMSQAIEQLQDGFLTRAQIAASHAVMGWLPRAGAHGRGDRWCKRPAHSDAQTTLMPCANLKKTRG
jgi:hypothetical protein